MDAIAAVVFDIGGVVHGLAAPRDRALRAGARPRGERDQPRGRRGGRAGRLGAARAGRADGSQTFYAPFEADCRGARRRGRRAAPHGEDRRGRASPRPRMLEAIRRIRARRPRRRRPHEQLDHRGRTRRAPRVLAPHFDVFVESRGRRPAQARSADLPRWPASELGVRRRAARLPRRHRLATSSRRARSGWRRSRWTIPSRRCASSGRCSGSTSSPDRGRGQKLRRMPPRTVNGSPIETTPSVVRPVV